MHLWLIGLGLQITCFVTLEATITTTTTITNENPNATTSNKIVNYFDNHTPDRFSHINYDNIQEDWANTATVPTVTYSIPTLKPTDIFNVNVKSTTATKYATVDNHRLDFTELHHTTSKDMTIDVINIFKNMANDSFKDSGLGVADLGYNDSKNVDPNELILKWYLRKINETKGDIFLVNEKAKEATGWDLDNVILNFLYNAINESIHAVTTSTRQPEEHSAPYYVYEEEGLRQKKQKRSKTLAEIKLERYKAIDEILNGLNRIKNSFTLNPVWKVHYTEDVFKAIRNRIRPVEIPVFVTDFPRHRKRTAAEARHPRLHIPYAATRQVEWNQSSDVTVTTGASAGESTSVPSIGATVSPFVTYLYNDMAARGNGYLTTFYRNVFESIVSKDPHDASPLYHSANDVIKGLHENNSLAVFGDQVAGKIVNFVDVISGTDPNAIRNQATTLVFFMTYRRIYAGPEMNTLLDYADSLYDDHDGLRLFQTLEELHNYPNSTKSDIEIATDIVNYALLEPYHKITAQSPSQSFYLVQTLNELIRNRRSFTLPARRYNMKNESLYKVKTNIFTKPYDIANGMRHKNYLFRNKIMNVNNNNKINAKYKINNVNYKNAARYKNVGGGDNIYSNKNKIRQTNTYKTPKLIKEATDLEYSVEKEFNKSPTVDLKTVMTKHYKQSKRETMRKPSKNRQYHYKNLKSQDDYSSELELDTVNTVTTMNVTKPNNVHVNNNLRHKKVKIKEMTSTKNVPYKSEKLELNNKYNYVKHNYKFENEMHIRLNGSNVNKKITLKPASPTKKVVLNSQKIATDYESNIEEDFKTKANIVYNVAHTKITSVQHRNQQNKNNKQGSITTRNDELQLEMDVGGEKSDSTASKSDTDASNFPNRHNKHHTIMKNGKHLKKNTKRHIKIKKIKKHLKRKHPKLYKKYFKHHQPRGKIYFSIKRRKHKNHNSNKHKKHIKFLRNDHNYENFLKKRVSRKRIDLEEIEVNDTDAENDDSIENQKQEIQFYRKLGQTRFRVVQQTTPSKGINYRTGVKKHNSFRAISSNTAGNFRQNKTVIESGFKAGAWNPKQIIAILNEKQSNTHKIDQNKIINSMYITTDAVRSFKNKISTFRSKKGHNKVRQDSSYSDEENCLKMNLYDALRHGNRKFVRAARRSKDNQREHIKIKDLSSYTDNEGIIKNNIYKVFEYVSEMGDTE